MNQIVSKEERKKEYQKAYQPKYRKEHRKEINAYHREYSATVKSQFNVLKRVARRRNLEVMISLEEFVVLRTDPCYYCSDPILGKMGYGLDRKDSSIGYILSNVVSCCRVCNQAKSNRPIKEFLDWAKRVVANSEKKID